MSDTTTTTTTTTSTTPHAPTRIALVLCTTRQPRACPQIATFIQHTLTTHSHSPSSPTTPSYTLHHLDLLSHLLPLLNEPFVPSTITSPTQYTHAHTRSWSTTVSSFDAFIFITPQYNWGYPAAIKNAIDYLYHEWQGKAAMVVSCGGHGGGKANRQLREVLAGVRMRVVGEGVELGFEGREMLERASRGEELGLGGEGGAWEGEREGVVRVFGELLRLAGERKEIQAKAMEEKK